MLFSALPSAGAAAPEWTDTGARDAVVDAWWDEPLKDPLACTPVGSTSRCDDAAVNRRAGLLTPALRTVGISAMPSQGGPADSLTVSVSVSVSVSVAVAPSPAVPLREGRGLVLWLPRGHVPRLETLAR